MPLYEYTCRKCSGEFEQLVYSDDEQIECPQCRSESVEKKLSLPAKPQTKSLPMTPECATQGPPCGPRCCRL
jgi:putative FmdB family regulatory protein